MRHRVPYKNNLLVKFLNGDNIIAQAQSGTGKTGAFVIGTLNNLEVTKNKTQILVIAPTRELITQISPLFIRKFLNICQVLRFIYVWEENKLTKMYII